MAIQPKKNWRTIKMKTFAGPVLFLERSDINTDEIIAANYLAELPKQELTSHLFENLKLTDLTLKVILPERKSLSQRKTLVVVQKAKKLHGLLK